MDVRNRSPTPASRSSYHAALSPRSSSAPGRYSTGFNFIETSPHRAVDLAGRYWLDLSRLVFVQASVHFSFPSTFYGSLVRLRQAGVEHVSQFNAFCRLELRHKCVRSFLQS